MLKFTEQINPLNEKGMNTEIIYSEIPTRSEVIKRILEMKKRAKKFRVCLSFITIDSTVMEGLYNKVRVEGSKLFFSDLRTPFNRFIVNAKDIVSAQFGEVPEAKYEVINLRLRTKQSLTITPWK